MKNIPEKKHESVANLERKLEEFTALYEISNAINSSVDLEKVMAEVMKILHEKMGMERGTLTLLDSRTGELIIELAHGMDKKAMERGRYRIGEGITGKVVEAGEPIVVPNVGNEPLFLNRTKSRDLNRNNISFICVPIKLDKKTIGALSVDRLFSENISFEEDVRLLTIISSMVAQAVHIHQLHEKDKEQLTRENILLKRELKKKFHPASIIGESKRMEDVYSAIETVSHTKATVMLRGESGTGKEMVAHAIHYSSNRTDGPFIKVSCAALPETLLESELFGYEKGAFTGAAASKPGRFEMANGGTLFLDEIGDISPSTQIKLLRVLQEKEFERVGGTHTLRVDIRLITATNKDLEAEVKAGKFREDLYYRLNVFPIFLPSLRERKEDIPLLLEYFMRKSSAENRKNIKFISDAAIEKLVNYSWPGNVREMENAIERAVILCKGDTLTPELFPILGVKKGDPFSEISSPAAPPAAAGAGEPDSADLSMVAKVEALEKQMIKDTLARTGGNQRKAAQILGVTERILGYKMKNYGLK